MVRFYAARKIPKDVRKSMNSLQAVLVARCEKSGDRGCTYLDLLYVGKPYVNEYGEKRFASSGRIYRNVRLLRDQGILLVK
jgi:hypothetical protein